MYLNKTGLWVFHSYFLLLEVHYRLDICLIFPSSFSFIPFRQVAPCLLVIPLLLCFLHIHTLCCTAISELLIIVLFEELSQDELCLWSISGIEPMSHSFIRRHCLIQRGLAMLFFLRGWDFVTLSLGFTRNTIPPFSFLLAFVNACLLARSRKQSSPIKNKTETKTKKKERHDTGFQLIIPSHVMIKVCDGYMKTPIVRGVLQGLYTEIHFWDPLRPALAS